MMPSTSTIDMDIETQSFSKEFFATHVVQRQGKSLISKDTAVAQNQSWTFGNISRYVPALWEQNYTNPDAVNDVFKEKFNDLLGTPFRTDNKEDVNNLKGRLTHLIENAKVFEDFKKDIFSGAVTAPRGLDSLGTLIQQAESRKTQLEALSATPPEARVSPRKQHMEKLNRNLALGMTHLLKSDPKTLDGIFRTEGEGPRVTFFTAKFLETEPESLAEDFKTENSPHNVAKAMARAIRNLKPPLVDSTEIYPIFIAAEKESNEEKKINLLRKAIGLLPPENQAIFKMIITNLRQFTELQANTRMDAKNLAVVWAPNLLQSPQEKLLEDREIVVNLIKFMIEKNVI